MSKSIGIEINSIKEEEFKFSDNDLKSINRKLLSLGIRLGFDADVKKSTFAVKLTILYNYKEKEEDELIELLKFVTSMKFKVKNLKKIIKIDENDDSSYEMPDQLMVTFVGAIIASTRGMLTYKLAGTLLSDYYLPLVDVKSLLDIHLADSE